MNKATFTQRNSPFYDAVKAEAEKYFSSKGISSKGDWRLFLKAFFFMSAPVVLYITLVFFTPVWWVSLILCALLGFTLSGVGFNVMHDSCHGGFSENKTINNLMGYSMNLLGSSMFIWKMKHNVIHHTYTNVDGIDDDIIKVPFLRHCPSQPYKKFHRFQHIYSILLYAISIPLWVFVTDMQKYFGLHIAGTPIKNFPLREHIIYWVSKLYYVAVFIVIPWYVLGFGPFIIGYAVTNIVFGLVLSIVFQLAHAVEITQFTEANDKTLKIDTEWAVYQVATTADFAAKNKFVTWFVGGLNFQVVHHLFPFVSHVHYPALQPLVKNVCAKFGVKYNEFDTFNQAVASHSRWMKTLGSHE